MLARRALVLSPDKELAKVLKLALLAAGAVVETATSVADLSEEVNADLCVIHLPDNQLASLTALGKRVSPDAWLVAVLGKPDLSAMVDVMRAAERVASILVADRFQPSDLTATVSRLLHGDIFGLEKVVPWGTRIYSTLVADYQGKAVAISQLSEFAGAVGVRRKYREALEQCADEMLMNALYDAPVGDDGKPLYSGVSTRDRVSLELGERVVVQYACDSRTFALSVRDAYGSFERETLLRFLHKCLHSEQQIDRKVGGAGLGLYLMANSSTRIYFNLLPGVATEVICVFDTTAAKLELQHLGVFSEKVDATGRLTISPSGAVGNPVDRRRRGAASPAPSWNLLVPGLVAAIGLLLALIALVAYPRIVKDTGAVVVVTTPPGAAIDIDGRVRGTSDADGLRVDGLTAETGHRIVARLDGHGDAESLVQIDSDRTADVRLSLVPRTASVTIESDPSGATVLFEGKALGVTPLTATTLPPERETEITLRLPGYRDNVRRLKVPAPGGQVVVSASLTITDQLATLDIKSEPPGASVLRNGERLPGLTTPIEDHLVEAGRRHTFTFELDGHMPAVVETSVARGARDVPVTAKLAPGGALTVTSNVPARLSVADAPDCKRRALPATCGLKNGPHRVTIENAEPYLSMSFTVAIEGAAVRRDLRLGIVNAPAVFRFRAGRGLARSLALTDGVHALTLVPNTGGPGRTMSVDVRAGTTITLP